MVSKPTGRPRGRPRKVTEEGPLRPVGRPTVELQDEPDRYFIALFFALTGPLEMQQRPAARLIAAFTRGENVNEPDEDFLRFLQKHRDRVGGQIMQLARLEEPGASTATLEGRADTIRKKARGRWNDNEKIYGWSERDAMWLHFMSLAFVIAFNAKPEIAKHLAGCAASIVGEAEFASKVLFAMIDAATRPKSAE